MADETLSIKRAEQVDHQLVRGIGIPALTANIVSSTIGAGIFVIPATVAAGLGPAAPLAFICCAIAMVLFVTCFAIAGSRVSLTGGLYAYVEVAFGKYVGFLAGILYFLTALGAVAGVVNVLANSIALVIPFLGGSADAHRCDACGLWRPSVHQHSRGTRRRGRSHDNHGRETSPVTSVHWRRNLFH